MTDFKLVTASKANGQILTEKYRSQATGLTVVIAQVEGPLVNGYFCLATEAHDDDGLPHTLEHLIFLGSDSYPYKGVLDLLSNRCLSSGTNAWTDTDHTCYTMTTAGAQGFLSLMPVYVDHVLYPTLTDSGFITEVHHITGEGEDGGVVYCEMQGCENNGENKVHLEMLRAIYPPECGYRYETGGIMKNLRESTTNEKVINYHKAFYRPENLTLIITGIVKPEEVFKALENVEEKIKSRKPLGEFKRPWQSEVAPLKESVDLEVPYPEDEEENGMVYMAWRGPQCTKDITGMLSTMVILEYLTESAVSPLQASFVEIEDPLASEVSYSFIENSVATMYLMFRCVPIKKLDLIEGKLRDVLEGLVSGKVAWDAERMLTVINKRIQEQISQIENSPHDSVAGMVIGDALYGNTDKDFELRLNSVAMYEELKSKPSSYWLEIMRQYMIGQPRVLIKGKPSIKLEADMKEAEKSRIAAQVERLGTSGLNDKGTALESAMEENEKEAPEEVLTSVPIPSADSINLHPVTSFTSNNQQNACPMDLSHMPFFTKLNQIKSQFVYLHVVMNTSALPSELVMYLPLLLELIGESPVMDNNETEIPYEKVVAQLEEDFVAKSFGVGLSGGRFLAGSYPHAAVMFFQVEPAKYEKAVEWISLLVNHTKIDKERVKITACKMENSISEMKRSGSSMSRILTNSIVFENDCIINKVSFIQQQSFLKNVIKQLDKDGGQAIMKNLEALKTILQDSKNLSLHISADIDIIKKHSSKPESPWKKHFKSKESCPAVVEPGHFKRDIGTKTSDLCHVVYPLGSCESSFLVRCVPAISDARDPDLPGLMVYLQYINQLEGPMWRQIRGAGYAYGYAMYPDVSKGLLYFTLYRATSAPNAFAEGKKIGLDSLLTDEPIDAALFESSKPSLIFELIEKEKTIGDVVAQSLASFFKQTDPAYKKDFFKKVSAMTEAEMKSVAVKYMKRLFDETAARTVVVCSTAKLAEIQKDFAEQGVKLTAVESLDKFKNC